MMLGFLLARAGVRVLVLEKHADFLRDFRGDTIHPSTLELMHELGLLEEFLKIPHDEIDQLTGLVGDDRITIANFAHVPTRCKFVALMPQWDFLNFLVAHAKHYAAFELRIRSVRRRAGDPAAVCRGCLPSGHGDVRGSRSGRPFQSLRLHSGGRDL